MPTTTQDDEGRTWVEVNEIEILPESPWRFSIRKRVEGLEKQIRLERSRLVYAPYETGSGIVYPPSMSDGQIAWFARRIAERDVQGALVQQGKNLTL